MLQAALACRRSILLLLGSAALAAGTRLVGAAEFRIDRLIVQSRGRGTISQRVDFISAAARHPVPGKYADWRPKSVGKIRCSR